MNLLLAPNAMKGALSAIQIAAITGKTLRRKFRDVVVTSLPVADGGNGMLDCLMNELGGTVLRKEVTGPLPSLTVTARFGITADGIGIIESAEAIGLHLITPSPESIAQSTSAGVGELINELQRQHCKELWIGLGGSATNDGGAGMARSLGVQLYDHNREPLEDGAVRLVNLSSIDTATFHMNDTTETNCPIKILSDVTNPLLGKHGATYTFARQKGASEEQLPYLEAALRNFSDVVESNINNSKKEIPGSGAAGGLGFGLLAFCNGEIVSGIDFILDTIAFDKKLQECDAVVTTEGMIDEQTLFGKGLAGIAERARKYQKPVHVFVGRIQGSRETLMTRLHLASLTEISPPGMKTAEALKNAPWLLADALFHHTF